MIHCGFIGILGLPNAGKSSLLNAVLEEKLVIVSDKPQTTRQSFSGIISTKDYQLILLDAPGYVEPKAGLFEFLNKEFVKVIEKSEHLLVLISHDQKQTAQFDNFWKEIKASNKPKSYLFTKSDLKETEFVTQLKEELKSERNLEVSLKKEFKESLNDFLKEISQTLKAEHHPLYDTEMISLDNTREIVAEFIREQCFLQLEKEIPFSTGVIVKSYKRQKGMLHIEANILIEKENHKAIVIGKNGSRLKKIGQESRKSIENLLGEKIFLGLHVAFKKNWMKKKSIMSELGYEHDKR